jgi:hypothetical protein
MRHQRRRVRRHLIRRHRCDQDEVDVGGVDARSGERVRSGPRGEI